MPELLDKTALITWGWNIAAIVIALGIAKLVQILMLKFFRSKRIFRNGLTQRIADKAHAALLCLLVFIALCAVLPLTHIEEAWLSRAFLFLRPACVAAFGWLVIGIAQGSGEWLETHDAGQKRDALGTRRFTTQIRILMRIIVTAIIVLTIVGMAMVIPALRQLGMSLFASAGVAGIVLGVAAKETLSNLIAGAQLALTQQILLGDDVVVNGQSGKIEEITSSYVVLKTWDMRRLVVPLRFFMENSFENWTYHESDLLGPVYFFVDYSIDMNDLRAQAERIVKASPYWDGKRFEVLVTDSKEMTLQIRVSVSARNSAELWLLQCETREKIIDHLQRNQPSALPKTRGEQKAIEQWGVS